MSLYFDGKYRTDILSPVPCQQIPDHQTRATRHRHPYDEIQFIRAGRGVWTVNGKTFEGSAGDVFVIKAGEIHSFKAVGDSPLVQVDVHLNPRFIQENL